MLIKTLFFPRRTIKTELLREFDFNFDLTPNHQNIHQSFVVSRLKFVQLMHNLQNIPILFDYEP